jgi:hypothetical protein
MQAATWFFFKKKKKKNNARAFKCRIIFWMIAKEQV